MLGDDSERCRDQVCSVKSSIDRIMRVRSCAGSLAPRQFSTDSRSRWRIATRAAAGQHFFSPTIGAYLLSASVGVLPDMISTKQYPSITNTLLYRAAIPEVEAKIRATHMRYPREAPHRQEDRRASWLRRCGCRWEGRGNARSDFWIF